MRRNIIITGGGLTNKGAEAMTFITVSEIKKRFPNHDVLVYSPNDIQKKDLIKEIYTFKFIGWHPIKFAKAQKNLLLKSLCYLKNRTEFIETEEIYKNTDLMIDISGYALGSNWSNKICKDYLYNFLYAMYFNIPIYLMPQSFGPFNFATEEQLEVDKLIRLVFSKIKVVCAREEQGYRDLKETYKLDNVVLLPDLVLNNKDINLSSVFKEIPNIELPQIDNNSIAVIPNQRNIEVTNETLTLCCYEHLINEALKYKNKIYVFSHSTVDKVLCKIIKEKFKNEDRVVLLEQEFSSIEFNELVKKFDFIIGSRFHSIVHAFKNGIPCVALGWSEKYKVLLSTFMQDKYMIDIREEYDEKINAEKVKEMATNYLFEKNIIINKLVEVQQNNVFDILPKSL